MVISETQNNIQLPQPTQCVFWKNPKRVRGRSLESQFELVETYAKSEHFWRYLLKCRECGQLYFQEFREETDWVSGNDPQYTIYIPVENEKRGKELGESTTPNQYLPRLHIDFPSDAKSPSVYWSNEYV